MTSFPRRYHLPILATLLGATTTTLANAIHIPAQVVQTLQDTSSPTLATNLQNAPPNSEPTPFRLPNRFGVPGSNTRPGNKPPIPYVLLNDLNHNNPIMPPTVTTDTPNPLLQPRFSDASPGMAARAASPTIMDVPGATYLGCFQDGSSIHVLDVKRFTDFALTPELCRNLCQIEEVAFFGMKRGYYCHCGEKVAQFAVRAPEEECDDKCDGAPDYLCGGDDRINVYQITSTVLGGTAGAAETTIIITTDPSGQTITTTSTTTQPPTIPVPDSSSTATSGSPGSSSSNPSPSTGMSKSTLTGIIIGAVAGSILLASLVTWLCIRTSQRRYMAEVQRTAYENGGDTGYPVPLAPAGIGGGMSQPPFGQGPGSVPPYSAYGGTGVPAAAAVPKPNETVSNSPSTFAMSPQSPGGRGVSPLGGGYIAPASPPPGQQQGGRLSVGDGDRAQLSGTPVHEMGAILSAVRGRSDGQQQGGQQGQQQAPQEMNDTVQRVYEMGNFYKR